MMRHPGALGKERKLDLALRLGWMHEFAYTGRPITAAFAGGPAAAFTVYGATPQRDSTVVGLAAGTTVNEATQVFLRYDAAVGSGTDSHTLNVGVRFLVRIFVHNWGRGVQNCTLQLLRSMLPSAGLRFSCQVVCMAMA